jgi:hypothetical protein
MREFVEGALISPEHRRLEHREHPGFSGVFKAKPLILLPRTHEIPTAFDVFRAKALKCN